MSDLIAGVIGISLGIAVVILGLRRNLSDVTRSWLPRYGEALGKRAMVPDFFDSGQGRRQLSPLTRKLNIWLYLFMSLAYAAFAVLGVHERLMHVSMAVLFAVAAVTFMLRRPST